MNTNHTHVFALLVVGLMAGWYASGRPAGFGAIAVPSFGQVAECGTFYRVRKGDTLQAIALEAYGNSNYQRIFEANRHVLRSAAKLDVGDELLIPCADGGGAGTGSLGMGMSARAATPADAKQGVPADREAPLSAALVTPEIRDGYRRITFVTGSDFAPFVHADLPESGMTAEMIRLAMAATAPSQDYGIAMVTDWSTHLDRLADRSFDLGFPWFRPDCTRAARLEPALARRCAEFEFSQPLFEIPVGYYVAAGDPLGAADSHGRLRGRHICRPANHFTFDLDQQGLTGPETAIIYAPSAEDCFRLLMRGDVEVVTLGQPLAGALLTRLGLIGEVVEVPALQTRQTLHVIVPKSHPQAQALLGLVDAGLDELKRSGRWFEVVSRHLGEHGLSMR